MSVGVLERPATASAPEASSGGVSGPPGHAPLVLAPLQARVAPAVPDPAPHHRRGGGRRGRLGRRGQHAAGGQRRVRHGPRPRDLQPDAHEQVVVGQPRSLWRRRSPRSSTPSARCRSSPTRRSPSPARRRRTSSGPRTPMAPMAGRCCSCSRGTTRPGRTRSPSRRAWRPSSTCRVGRHLVPGRQDRRRHRAEPPEPARRVRARPARPGDAPDAGERPLRRIAQHAPLVPQLPVLLHHDAGRHEQQPHQPVDHHPGVGDRGHAPHRLGVDRRLHRAGTAPHALPRHARVDGGDRPQRPAGPGGQRRHRRGRRRRLGVRAGSGALAGLPAAQRAERAPRHSDLRAALGT